MSVFVRQHSVISKFENSDSWIILSSIEKQIKEKIERIGTPLKDWDITINYGIKTGYNDAFIISGETRKELIEQDAKSEEIIRPILRGRDIKKYGNNFAEKYVICARISSDIPAKYRAIHEYLEKFRGERKLGDNSTTKVFNRPWWSWMQEPVNYWDDFNKQKIMYPNMTKFLPFYLDEDNFLQNDKSFMITGENLFFLTAFLNSSLFKYCFIDNFPELQGGTREIRKIFLDKIPVLKVTSDQNEIFKPLVLKCQQLVSSHKNIYEVEKEIDNKIFDLYKLSDEERSIVGFIVIQ